MKPSVGRIVVYACSVYDDAGNNGAKVAPAVVTRVWSDSCVNLRVFMDGPEVAWRTSVALFESQESFESAGVASGCYWPPRV